MSDTTPELPEFMKDFKQKEVFDDGQWWQYILFPIPLNVAMYFIAMAVKDVPVVSFFVNVIGGGLLLISIFVVLKGFILLAGKLKRKK